MILVPLQLEYTSSTAEAQEEEREEQASASDSDTRLRLSDVLAAKKGREPDQINTCPICHLALPMETLRWHEVSFCNDLPGFCFNDNCCRDEDEYFLVP